MVGKTEFKLGREKEGELDCGVIAFPLMVRLEKVACRDRSLGGGRTGRLIIQLAFIL